MLQIVLIIKCLLFIPTGFAGRVRLPTKYYDLEALIDVFSDDGLAEGYT
jgi:hypothetical protein